MAPAALPAEGPRTFTIKSVTSADGADVPGSIVHVVKESLETALDDAGLSSDQGTLSVEVTVTGYRLRTAFNRFMFGAFAGSDSIEADVRVFAEDTEQPVTEATVSSSNAAAFGNERTVGKLLADKVVEYLRNLGSQK